MAGMAISEWLQWVDSGRLGDLDKGGARQRYGGSVPVTTMSTLPAAAL
jgi:hypothetical protein